MKLHERGITQKTIQRNEKKDCVIREPWGYDRERTRRGRSDVAVFVKWEIRAVNRKRSGEMGRNLRKRGAARKKYP